MSEKLSIKRQENTEVKKNSCLYFWHIKTVKQIMALKDITTQNPEPAAKKILNLRRKG